MRYLLLCSLLLSSVAHAGSDANAPPVAYGEMYVAGGAVTAIDTANVRHALTTLVAGHLDHNSQVTMTTGATGSITAYATYAGGAATLVTDATHGLTTGEIVCIVGSTNYNACKSITKIDADSFTIATAFAGDDGASTWRRGSRLTITTPGDYELTAAISATKAAGSSAVVTFEVLVETTVKSKCTIIRAFTSADTGATALSCLLDDLVAGDDIFVTVKSDNTDDLTVGYANLQLHYIH